MYNVTVEKERTPKDSWEYPGYENFQQTDFY